MFDEVRDIPSHARSSARPATSSLCCGRRHREGQAGRNPALTRNRGCMRAIAGTSRKTSTGTDSKHTVAVCGAESRVAPGRVRLRSGKGACVTRRHLPDGIAGVVIALVAIAFPAASRPAGAATSCGGVTVVVDFTHFGGSIERGCAPNPSTGLDALHQAGFATAGTTLYGDAFVCRIDNLPAAGQESCTSTPPASAYWAYYRARATDSDWTYSPIGASSTHPSPGSVEGYAFGARAVPGIAPRSAALPPPPPPPPTTTASAPTPTTGASTTGGTYEPSNQPGTGSGSGPAAQGSGVTTASGEALSTVTTIGNAKPHRSDRRDTTSTLHAPTTTTSGQEPAVVERSRGAPSSRSQPSSGSPVALIVALALVGVGAGIGWSFVRARRRGSL